MGTSLPRDPGADSPAIIPSFLAECNGWGGDTPSYRAKSRDQGRGGEPWGRSMLPGGRAVRHKLRLHALAF